VPEGTGATEDAAARRVIAGEPPPTVAGWVTLTILLLGVGDQQDAVDLVHLEELHLDAFLARGRQVLAHVVRTDRELAMAAVGEHRELHASRSTVVEQGLDGCPDRAPRVQHVVDEHDGHPFEREVEGGRADERLCVQRRLTAADLHVVAIEGDVELTERKFLIGAFLDQPAKSLRKRNTATVDPDERDLIQIVVSLDHLVGDPGEGPIDRFSVEEDLPG
jgi:hypothetical protein